MLNLPLLSVLVMTAAFQTAAPQSGAPGNPACTVLTAAEGASLIGAGGKQVGVTSGPQGATCMIQNGEKVITILQTTQATADAASGLWAAKERIVNGKDIAGWAAKAYVGAMRDASVVGLAKGATFLEVRVSDQAPGSSAIAAKLQTVMKAVAARLP
jgi:hypothetical protein